MTTGVWIRLCPSSTGAGSSGMRVLVNPLLRSSRSSSMSSTRGTRSLGGSKGRVMARRAKDKRVWQMNVLLALSAVSLQSPGAFAFYVNPSVLLHETRGAQHRYLLSRGLALAAPGGASFRPHSVPPVSSRVVVPSMQVRTGEVRAMEKSSMSGTAAQAVMQGAWYDGLIKYPVGSPEWELCEKLLKSIDIGQSFVDGAAQLQQGSQAWLSARKHRLTASNFGAAAGRNPYSSREALAQEMLEPTFKGNEATKHGAFVFAV